MMDAGAILETWDACLGQNPVFKGIALASLASSVAEPSQISEWSVEKRDTAIFHLRRTLFGSEFHNISHCPKCALTVEWDFSFPQLAIPDLKDVPDNIAIPLEYTDHHLRLRLPNSHDLLKGSESEIIHSCILNDMKDPEKVDWLSEEIVEKVTDLFSKNCHTSNITYSLTCQECHHQWQVLFDIVAYLWKEIDQWAKSFLDQIALLAKTFGWSERDIMNMTQNRRNHYLNLVHS